MFDAAVGAASPKLCVADGKTIVIGAGKVSAAMAKALRSLAGAPEWHWARWFVRPSRPANGPLVAPACKGQTSVLGRCSRLAITPAAPMMSVLTRSNAATIWNGRMGVFIEKPRAAIANGFKTAAGV